MKLSNRRCVKGFTLLEVLIATAILAFCLCGLLATYVNMFFLTSLLRDSTLATSAVQAELEKIRNTGYNSTSLTLDLKSDYGIDGNVTVRVDTVSGYSNLKKVKIAACFKSRDRLIGNDITNCTSSPVEAITYVCQ